MWQTLLRYLLLTATRIVYISHLLSLHLLFWPLLLYNHCHIIDLIFKRNCVEKLYTNWSRTSWKKPVALLLTASLECPLSQFLIQLHFLFTANIWKHSFLEADLLVWRISLFISIHVGEALIIINILLYLIGSQRNPWKVPFSNRQALFRDRKERLKLNLSLTNTFGWAWCNKNDFFVLCYAQ